MRDKTIGCICTRDDAIECMRARYNALGDDSEGEGCSCSYHDVMQEEDEAMSDWDDHLTASDGVMSR